MAPGDQVTYLADYYNPYTGIRLAYVKTTVKKKAVCGFLPLYAVED